MGFSGADLSRLSALVDSCKCVTSLAKGMADAQLTVLTHELCKVAARVVMRYSLMLGMRPDEVDARLRLRGFQEESCETRRVPSQHAGGRISS